MNRAKLYLVMFVAGLGGLCLLTGLEAGDEPEKKPAKPKAAEQEPMPMRAAVKPKPLSDAIKKGLKYLAAQQHDNGGWGQGGGWRTSGKGGRVEGKEVKDPPDVGNTAIALLAFVRAGNTQQQGPYAKNVAKGVAFICSHIEKADDKTLYITNVRDTQIQSKIGPYADTFLASMVLAELKGKAADEKNDKRLVKALNKTIAKMEKNQRKDGTFAGNTGWASVLSQGLANKGFNYAAQRGVMLQEETLSRITDQVAANFDPKAGKFKAAGTGGFAGGASSGGAPGRAPASAPSDAGIPLYQAGAYVTNSADVINTYRRNREKAQKTLGDAKASKKEKDAARKTLAKIEKADKLRVEATKSVVAQLNSPSFAKGFGNNGGEEFLSHMNIGEALLLQGGDAWKKWDSKMTKEITRVQDGGGSWSGHHCITGKTFCTATAMLVLMVDRTPIPAEKAEKSEAPKK